MDFYLTKSGLQNYDLSRAYGLASIIKCLEVGEVLLSDFGYFYHIESGQNPNLADISQLTILTGDDLPWNNVFLTIKQSDRNKKIRELKESITNKEFIENLLKKHQNPIPPVLLSSKTENFETLLQSFDLGAAKGLRERIRLQRSYSEGSQVYIPKEDFILSVIGHLNCTIWRWNIVNRDKKLVAILLYPEIDGIKIGKFLELKKQVEDAIKRHQAGTFAMLSYTATFLAKLTWGMKFKDRIFAPKFSSLAYGIMTKSGQQMKPFAGGIYPLDFLNQVADSPQGGQICDSWLDIFLKTNMKRGNEQLAINLSNFIVHPSLETFDRYLKTHLRVDMKKEIYISLYDVTTMEGIMQYV